LAIRCSPALEDRLAGRPLTVTSTAGTFTYTYNTAGEQSQTTRPDGLIIKYGYDADGNASSITYPDTWLYTYSFDELDRMIGVAETAPGSSATSLVTYSYDPLSRRTQNLFGNSTSTAYAYDAYSGVSSIAHTFVGTGAQAGVTMTYTRDYAEQRTEDAASVTTYMYHPPAAGTTTYTPNNLNQYGAINGNTLNYDGSGNLITDPTAALGASTYSWDTRNRLITAANTQNTSSYTYDAFDRRASKTVNGVATIIVSDGNREIADYTSAGVETARFVYGLDNAPLVEEPIGSGAGSPKTDTWYHHLDALGTTLALTSHTGALLHAYSTSLWGETATTVGTPFRFAGMRMDAETMLYYDHARYYSPAQGRFLSPDPIGVQGGIDIYAYTGNNPLNGVDLSGLASHLGGGTWGVPCNVCLHLDLMNVAGKQGQADYGSLTVNNESIWDEGVYGPINSLYSYLPSYLEGPVIFLPGLEKTTHQVDLR